MAAQPSMPPSTTAVKNVVTVKPDEIFADPKENTRKISADDVAQMALSIEKNGQLQPVKVQLLPEGGFKLVYGYTRLAAIKKLNEKSADRQYTVRAEIVSAMEAKQAYRLSVIENFTRRNPSAIELAEQQKSLLEDYGESEADVAALFGWKGSDGIERLRASQKLLNLPKSIQGMVAGRELPVVAAIEMIGLTEPEMKDIVENADRIRGRIKGESVRKAVREKKSATTGEAVNKVRGRKEIAEFFANLTGPGEDDPVKLLAKKISEFCDGKLTEETAAKHFRALGGAIKNPKAPPPPPAPEVKEAPAAKPAKAAKVKKAPKPKARKAKPNAASAAPAEQVTEVTEVAEVVGEPQPVKVG